MDEAGLERAIGRIEGRLDGICREIGDIKKIVECKTNDCRDCRKELDEKDAAIEGRLDDVESTHKEDTAVRTWLNTRTGQIVVVCGFLLSTAVFIREMWPL